MLNPSIWRSEAYQWIKTNMPELHEELCAIGSVHRCRERLNEITGCQFEPHHLISESMEGYLAKLKEMQREK